MTPTPPIATHQDSVRALAPQLPTVLATVLTGYAEETHPFARLHRLTTAAETLTRWCATLALADLVACGRELPRSRLAQSLERPTFAQWRDILGDAIGLLGPGSPLAPLGPFVTGELFPLLAARAGPSSPERHVIALRNVLAHCGCLGADDQASYDAHHHAAFARLLAAATELRRARLVGCPEDDVYVSMSGCPGPGGGFPPWTGARPPRAAPGDVFLAAGGGFINLSPLVRYGDVFRYRGKGGGANPLAAADDPFVRNAQASPAPLLYFRSADQRFLEFTAFSSASHSQNPDRARFDDLYRLAEWKPTPRGGPGRADPRAEFDFSDLVRELTALFVGRDREVGQVVEWVRGGAGRVGWLDGPPGSGKSAVAAAVAVRVAAETPGLLVTHFFRATDPRCNRMKFLENAILALDAKPALSQNPDLRQEEFERLLARAAAARRVVFLLDGVDEITQHDRDFPALIFRNCPPGVAWVCSGRGEDHLRATFRTNPAAHVFFPDGLGGLGVDAARAILDAECDRSIYDLIARDAPDTPAGENKNAFLTALAERSGGLPIYLRLVVRDIWNSWLTFRAGGEERLPPGLDKYYDDVLDRLGISDESSLLTRVLCHLAVARAPLTRETLLAVMSADPLVAQGGSKDLLARTLEFGHVLMRAVPLAAAGAAAVGYALYHESFRDHMLADRSPVRLGIAAAVAAFARRARRWEGCRDDPFALDYVLRHGPAHLADADGRFGRAAGWTPAALAATLCNPAFLQAKVAAGMAYEAVADFGLAGVAGCGGAAEAYERAFGQEFPAFQPFPDTTAQQVVNNLLARYGRSDAVGRAAVRRGGGPGARFRRRNRRPAAHAAPALVRILGEHGDPVLAVAVSPDGGRIASADAAGRVRVWQTADGAAEAALKVSTHGLTAVLWLDGERVAAAGLDGFVHVWGWRAKAGEPCPPGSSVPVRAVAAFGGGFVTGGDDRAVRRWDAAGRAAGPLGEHRGRVFCAAGSPDGTRLVTGGEDGAVRVWDAAGGEVRTLRGGARAVRAVAFAPSGCAVSGSDQGAIEYWDLARGGLVQAVRAHRGPVNALAVVAAGTDPPLVVSGGGDGTIKVFDAPPVAPRQVLTGHAYSVNAVAAVPGAALVVSGGEDGTVRVWNLAAGGAAETLAGHDGRVTCLAVAPGGDRSVSGGEDGSVRVWSRDGDPLLTLRGHTRPVTAVRLVGRRIISASEDGTLRAWDAETGEAVRAVGGVSIHSGPGGPVTDAAGGRSGPVVAVVNVTPEGVVSLGRNGLLRAWDGELTPRAAAGLPEDVWELAAAAADGRVFAAGRSGAVVRWEIEAGLLHDLRGPTAPVSCLAAAPGGELAAGDRDGTVWLWAAGGAAPRATVGPAGDWPCVLCWPPGAGVVVAGTDAGRLTAHDPGTAAPRWSVPRHGGPVTALASAGDLVFSAGADGRVFATRAGDGGVVANVHTGQPVTCVSPAGAGRVAVGTLAGEVIVYELVGG
jgi:WD40 repeat protein